MKTLTIFLTILFVCSIAFAAEITLTIPDGKIQKVKDALKAYDPIPTDESGTPLYTDGQWAKERLRQWVIEQVYEYDKNQARDAAEAGINWDDGIAT